MDRVAGGVDWEFIIRELWGHCGRGRAGSFINALYIFCWTARMGESRMPEPGAPPSAPRTRVYPPASRAAAAGFLPMFN